MQLKTKPQSLTAGSAMRISRLRYIVRVQQLARITTLAITFQYASVAALLLMTNMQDVLAATNTASFQVGITIGGPQDAPSKVTTPRTARYTWGAAEISLERAGYTVSRRLSKSGDLYWFEAADAEGQVRAAVSAISGEIVSLVH